MLSFFKEKMKTISWLCSCAPTGIRKTGEELKCDYCGRTDVGQFKLENADFTICQWCIKKACGKALGEKRWQQDREETMKTCNSTAAILSENKRMLTGNLLGEYSGVDSMARLVGSIQGKVEF